MCMVLAGIMYVPLLIMEHSAGLYFTTFQMLNIGKLFLCFFFLESPRIFWNDIEEGGVGWFEKRQYFLPKDFFSP